MILFKPTVFKNTFIYLFIALGLAYIVLSYAAIIGPVAAWLLAINLVLFFAMGKDKFMAKLQWRRTPEGTLLWLGMAGGFPGLFLARYVFNHKSTKVAFQKPMWAMFILQILCIAYYFASMYGLIGN